MNMTVCLSVHHKVCLYVSDSQSFSQPINQSVCLSIICLSVHQCVCQFMSVHLSFCLSSSKSVNLSVCPSVHPSVVQCVRLSIFNLSDCLWVSPSVCLLLSFPPICLSVSLSICLSVCLSICLPVCPSVCLSVHLSVCLSVLICLKSCIQWYTLQNDNVKKPNATWTQRHCGICNIFVCSPSITGSSFSLSSSPSF